MLMKAKTIKTTSRAGVLRRSVLLLGAAAIAVSGCSNAKQGAVSGAGIGALSGLAIGSVTGGAGTGAAIGAVVGGVGGAVIGDQNRRKSEAAVASATKPTPTATNAAQPYATGRVLGNLVGEWTVRGSLGGDATMPVAGTARIVAEKNYFVRIELRFTDPRNGEVIEGTSVISQTGGRGLEMTNSFSSVPQVRRFKGEMDSTGTVFSFAQVDSGESPRKIILRVPGQAGFSADVWDGSKRVETYTFSPARTSALAAPAR
jgi:hypothetical protein